MNGDDLSFWSTFMPHGQCYMWRPEILWLNVISDLFIALAYFSIPVGLYIILRNRPTSTFRPLIVMFCLFIVACGFTHLFGIWIVWNGNYGIHGLSKAITAIISVATACMLLPRVAEISNLKNPDELEILNAELKDEIEHQRESAESHQRAEMQFQSYIQQAPDGILIANPSGEIEYCNDTINVMFGYESDELIGKWVTDLVPERLRSLISPVHNNLFDDAKARSSESVAEILAIRKTGGEFPAEISLSSVTSQKRPALVVTLRDISARKTDEQDAHKELLEMAHASRLSTVGQMAAALAHELNQPLTAMSNNLFTAMSMEKQKAEPDQEMLSIMDENYESAQRAGQIIRGLRQLVRKDGDNKEPTKINDLVMTTMKLIEPEARAASIDIKLDLDDRVPVALLDAVQTQQVIVNLGRNAIEALSEYEQERAITIKTKLKDENTLFVSVADSGHGLDAEVKEKLFQPYITSKQTGMGLGLSISRSIIEAQGGILWHEEADDHGAVFCFTLPISGEDE